MNKVIDRLMRNPATFEFLSLFAYAIYCAIFAVAALPPALLISRGMGFLDGSILMLFVFVLFCALAFYVFLVSAAVFVGFVERLITLGIKPGCYELGSPVFLRWLIYAGLHLWLVNIVLPFIRGNNWIKIYLRIAGAKVGKQTFVNTSHIYDTYLLEIADHVVVGGEAFLNCHLYENGLLNLGKIVLGEGTTIGGKAYLTPGTTTGKNSTVGIHTYLRRNTKVGDGDALITPPGASIRQVVKAMRGAK